MALALGCLFEKWPWPWGACWGRCLEGLEGFGGFGGFGVFAGQTVPLKAHRKQCCGLKPWGACWGSGLGPGVPAGEGVWRVLEGLGVLEGVWRVWKVLEGLEGLEGFGGCLEGLEGFGGFGGFWSVWSVCGLANGSFESQ